jgi:hypothetical protein
VAPEVEQEGNVNGKPHVHEVKIRRSDYETGRWVLTYGDTRVTVCNRWRAPNERLMRKAFDRALARHDRGTARAVERVELSKAFTEETRVAKGLPEPEPASSLTASDLISWVTVANTPTNWEVKT